MDGTTYTWMGSPAPLPTLVTQTSYEYTSTRSTFVLSAGAVTMNVTFLSPIFPTDLKRQSLPFSYVDVSVTSSDGNTHNVQLYTDITAGKHNDPLACPPTRLRSLLNLCFCRMGIGRQLCYCSMGIRRRQRTGINAKKISYTQASHQQYRLYSNRWHSLP